jgi:hypothetical protein
MGLAAVLVVVDGGFEDLLGDRQSVVLVEFDVDGALILTFGEVVMILVWKFCQADQRLHDALHIDHHGFHCAGQDGQLLVQEVAGSGNALAHQDFVGGAADPRQVDALCSGLPWHIR